MSGTSDNLAVLRGHIGIAARKKDAEAEQAARQVFNEAKASRAIREAIEAKGSLTDDARIRLTRLLLAGEKS